MPKKGNAVRLGVLAFVTLGALLLFYDTLSGKRVLVGVLSQLVRALMPVLIGAFLAYLLSPVIDFFERKLFSKWNAAAQSAGRPVSGKARAASLVITWLVIFFLLYLLLSVMIPELYKSVTQLVDNFNNYYTKISGWIQQLMERHPNLGDWAKQRLDVYYQDLETIITEKVLPQTKTVLTAVSGGIVSALLFLKDLLVGIIVSVYFLATKETCVAHARKVTCSLFSGEQVKWILRGTRKTDAIFSGFVRGKLLDSLIIGILCFIGCSILAIPYTPLVSVIVGVTNVIPFFGPFLGAIPSLFLILLASPLKALYFAIFVLALQQLDGNFIGPKILGGSTGLSSLWVIIAILVGGSFFGVAGMFFGVPVCACLYNLAAFLVERRLHAKNLPTDTANYMSREVPEEPAPPRPEETGKNE